MAWRIETHLIRGEVDNRIRGRITGRLWFLGRSEPLILELQGNASRDLAGRRLEFVNPFPRGELPDAVATRQSGVVGFFTASRKVKIPEIPLEEIATLFAQKKPLRWHLGNSVYFEWFSVANGHVVIEAADYQLSIDTESTWDMSPEEEEAQSRAAGDSPAGTSDTFTFVVSGVYGSEAETQEKEDTDDSEEEREAWATEDPLSEEEADELLADSDQLTDRLMARLDEAGENADLESILEEELERRRSEANEASTGQEDAAERASWLEELNRAAEEIANDPEFIADFERHHPLAERAREVSQRVMQLVERGEWGPDDATSEHPVVDLVKAVTRGSGKLAGALDGREWPPSLDECGLCIAWMKRARNYFTDAVVAADFCLMQHLLPGGELETITRSLVQIGSEIDEVISDLRERLSRGFD